MERCGQECARYADQASAASDRAHWKRKLEEDDFFKMVVESYEEFFELCEIRRRPVPPVLRTNYRWLHYQRAEFLK